MLKPKTLLAKTTAIEDQEIVPFLWSFAYFFCLLCGYFILRPVRDEMGIQGGVENLQWTFTGTFIVMLLAVPVFGAAVARFSRRRLVPVVYLFFISNLAIFYVLFLSEVDRAWVARAFFIWVSVFNLFVVSLFWSFMADTFTNVQARRLFGAISAGGSAGALVGPALTAGLSPWLGTINMLPFSIAFLLATLVCIIGLARWQQQNSMQREDIKFDSESTAIGGGVLAGAIRVFKSPYLAGICLFIILYVTTSTFLYFEQAHIIKRAVPDSGDQTALFAGIDLAVNTLTLFAQLLATARLVRFLGVPVTLALIPALLAIGFVALGFWPTLWVLVVFQVIRRAGNYAIAKPAREMLFTVIPREDKYKSKNFIDTVVYRGGDAASGWAFAGLAALGLELGQLAFIAVPLSLLWLITAFLLGLKQEKLRRQQENT